MLLGRLISSLELSRQPSGNALKISCAAAWMASSRWRGVVGPRIDPALPLACRWPWSFATRRRAPSLPLLHVGALPAVVADLAGSNQLLDVGVGIAERHHLLNVLAGFANLLVDGGKLPSNHIEGSKCEF